MFSSCNPNYAGTRCQNCTNCNCPPDQVQCKVGQWFCAKKPDVCKGQVKCGLSPVDFVNLCNGEDFSESNTFELHMKRNKFIAYFEIYHY